MYIHNTAIHNHVFKNYGQYHVIEHKKSIFHCSVVKADRQPDTMLKCSSSFVNEYCFIKKMNDFAVHSRLFNGF